MRESLTRRSFMKVAGTVAAGAALGGAVSSEALAMEKLSVDASGAGDADAEEQEFTCTCAWSCSFCQYHIYTRNGNVSHMLPKPDFDYRTCLKGRSRIQRTYSEARVRYPMRRVEGTPRGGGQWERITWDEAVKTIVDQWQKTEKEFGPLANTYYQGGGGAQGSLNGNAGLIMRLFNASDYDMFAAGFIFDVVSGEESDIPLAAIGRDGFSRSNEDAYYFERYDMELTPELREYALAHAPKA